MVTDGVKIDCLNNIIKLELIYFDRNNVQAKITFKKY